MKNRENIPEHLLSWNQPHPEQWSYTEDKDNHWNITNPKHKLHKKTKTSSILDFAFCVLLRLIGANGNSSKIFDLSPNNINTTIVTSIKFQNPRFIEFRSEKLMSDSEGSSGFSGAGRTIEEHVWALWDKIEANQWVD